MSLASACHDAPRDATEKFDRFNIPSGPVFVVHLRFRPTAGGQGGRIPEKGLHCTGRSLLWISWSTYPVWLDLATALLLATPLFRTVAGGRFSSTWFGATRHAITVGFICWTPRIVLRGKDSAQLRWRS
jgi:hypothetical protein